MQNEKVKELADKYLQIETYNLDNFEKELSKLNIYLDIQDEKKEYEKFERKDIFIGGDSVYINNVKFEYVEYIKIYHDEIVITHLDTQLATIEKENINTLIIEGYTEKSTYTYTLEELLEE